MSCVHKIDASIEKFEQEKDCKGDDAPMQQDFRVTQSPLGNLTGDTKGAGTPCPLGQRWIELAGSLLYMYIANTTSPNKAQAVGAFSRYPMSPTTAGWREAMRGLKYLKSTRNLALVPGGRAEELVGFEMLVMPKV